jgi:hypothetical protein
MTTRPFFGVAVMAILPCAGFPHLSLASGGSIPWSMALRRICVSGSAIASATFRSISVLPPRTRILTFFPSSRARETAIGCRESSSGERGTIRMDMISDRMSSRFCASDIASVTSRRRSSDTRANTSWYMDFPASSSGAIRFSSAGETSPRRMPSRIMSNSSPTIRRYGFSARSLRALRSAWRIWWEIAAVRKPEIASRRSVSTRVPAPSSGLPGCCGESADGPGAGGIGAAGAAFDAAAQAGAPSGGCADRRRSMAACTSIA